MAQDTPSTEEWRRLFEAVVRVKHLAPWKWMTESDVFGVQNPETDELGFVSVTGMLGEHYAVNLYLGPEGLYGFWEFEEVGHLVDPEGLLRIPQLHASFEDRNELHNKDRGVIKDLGFKFRGRQAWPMFRAYRPGFAPWFVEAAEARFLAHALDQVADVAPRFREDPSLLEHPGEESYLVRVPRGEGGDWEDRLMEVPPPEPAPILVEVDTRVLEELERLPRSEARLEVDFFMFPAPVGRKEARPYFPYMLLMVEAQSGVILGNELSEPAPSMEATWGSVPGTVARQFAASGVVPAKVVVDSELLYQLLLPLAEELSFDLNQSEVMPTLYAIKDFLLQVAYE